MSILQIQQRPSPNFNDRKTPAGVKPVRRLILHYTGMPDGQGAEDWLCNPDSGVSCHYIVHEDGRIVQMVSEDKRAWHAGVGSWRGEGDLNSSSVGIEIVNPGHEWGYRPFPENQMAAVTALVADIVARHGLIPWDVIGHSDMAPLRKEDPGELFDWKRLADQGLALAQPETLGAMPSWNADELAAQFQLFGYDVTDLPATIRAFQRHYRQQRVDGVPDAETQAILQHLLEQVAPYQPA